MNDQDLLNRRRLLAGTMGASLLTAGLIATGGLQGALAQDDATPEAGIGGTENATDETDETDETDAMSDSATSAIERATAAIDSAQLDRNAVAVQIDATTIDTLLGQAIDLRDRAQTAAAGGDAAGARTLAHAAAATAKAAGDLVEAQLLGAGLPSEEARASRTLAGAFETIQSVGEATADSTDADVAFSLATAQALYQSAFDLLNAGSYGQAAATAAVGARLARVAGFLADPDGAAGPAGDRGRSGWRGGGPGVDGRGGVGGDRDGGPVDGDDEPVEVSEPSF
jgi:hypothetical protein